MRMLDYHPDFKMVLPEGGVIRKEQVDSIVETAMEMPQISDMKVFLISGGDKMNASAANALLKVLEDSGRNKFLIAADGEVLNTISSRCRVIKLNCLYDDASLGHEKLDILNAGIKQLFGDKMKAAFMIKVLETALDEK